MNQWNPSERAMQPGSGGASTGVAQETKEQIERVGEAAKERVSQAADARKGGFTSGLDQIAARLDQAAHDQAVGHEGEMLAGYVAQAVHRLSDSLRDKRSDEIIELVKRGVRERPGVSIGVFFALGFMGARLFKD